MRKILAAAVAALMVAGGATAAIAQTYDAPTLKVKVSPTKAGTKKKPKNSSIRLVVTNNDPTKSLAKLAFTIPKTVKVSGKGFKTCSDSNIFAGKCPKGSKVGGGAAHALLGVNTTAPTKLTFKVTAYVGGKNAIRFLLRGVELPVNVIAPGKVSKGKLIVTVPKAAQQPTPGLWAGLVSLDSTLKGKAGKRHLVSTVGCSGGKQKFKVALTFANNGVSTPGTVTVAGASKCKK